MELYPSLFRFSLLMLFVPVLMGAGAGAVVTAMGIRRRRQLEAWPTATARVTATEVEAGEYRGPMFVKKPVWDLLVTYEYDAGGELFRARTSLELQVPRRRGGVDPDDVDEAASQARAALAEGLLIHVDPADPATSALPLEGAHFSLVRLGLFLAASGVSLAALIYVFTS